MIAPHDLAGRLGYLQPAGLEMPCIPVTAGADPGGPGPGGGGQPLPGDGGLVPHGPVQAAVPAVGAPGDDTVPSRSLF